MTIVCISDLHLGDRGPRDNFNKGAREDHFIGFLEWVEQQGAKLFILGDLFDWWQCNLSRSLVAYKDVVQKLLRLDACWVCGNHDGALVEFCDMDLRVGNVNFLSPQLPFTSLVAGRSFYFLHGHEADPYCHGDNPGIGEISAIVSGLLEDRREYGRRGLGENIIVDAMGTVSNMWKGLSFRQNRQAEIVAGVEKLRTEAGADVVVSGHTHEAGRIGNHHFNCGCWVGERNTFVRIEDDGTAAVYEWLPNGGGMSPYGHELEVGD